MRTASDTPLGRVGPALRRPAAAVRRLSSALAGAAPWRAFLSIFDQGVVSGTSFVTSVLIGRLCSQEDLGVYSLALSVVFILRGIQGELTSTPYMICCNRRE